MSEKHPLLHSLPKDKQYVLVIHGGAGTLERDKFTAEQEELYREALKSALYAGYEVLREGGEAMDAAVAAVATMEDCPLFNAGKGAVFNVAGKNELEASIMLSKPPASNTDISSTRRGLALTLLTRTKNPCKLAKALYLSPNLAPHPFIAGETAEKLAESLGQELVEPSYYFTERRWREHRRGLGLPEEPLPHGVPDKQSGESLGEYPKGTVGAVALDVRGCITAVTSTGGRTNKLVGRVGDTPIFGGGFWAEEWKVRHSWTQKLWRKLKGKDLKHEAIGISGTGDGDYFIRQATASTIAHRVRFLHQPLEKAVQCAVQDLLTDGDGAPGGVIAVDSRGNVALSLNCARMYRGVIRVDGIPKTAIFPDDILS
ncbi:hypothetical protein AMATHDRAFT_2484 [Amanita thiersii Skay4041]|uniref:Asparaginase n=1 Tax=Amanita thiersii Skay4041 TaxID=703135 RepID=A0A2A9NLY5_9AGAR|nr:hypothetical protein AMATHDRAFT_2484 [Amanita thiersii Skay4041]